MLNDLRYGIRGLAKTPVWTVTVGATLALGIGLTTAIFSLVYGVLLRQLPYPEPDRLVALWSSSRDPEVPRSNVSPAMWRYWRTQSRSFEDISMTRPIANFNLTGRNTPERLQGARTTWNVATILGIQPLLGRMFTEEETQRDARVAVLSYGLWQRRFGKDPGVVGRPVQLNGAPFEIIGVMPEEFHYPSRDFELWTPLYIDPQAFQVGGDNSYWSIARLKPGVGIGQAQAEMSTIMQRLGEQYPAAIGPDARVEPLLASDVAGVKTSLYVAMAAAGCVLLVGCLNLAVLLIGRARVRDREMAVRAALGASAWRLVRQMLAEVLPLGLVGAAGGLVLAQWLLRLGLPWLPATMPRVESIGLHPLVWLFSVVCSVSVVLIAALLPACRASRPRLTSTVQHTSRTVARGGSAHSILVIAQVALTLVVLFAGGLFLRSVLAVLDVNLGFTTHQVLTMHLAVTRAEYPKDPQVADYYRRLEERIGLVPGVRAVGFVNRLPLSGLVQINPMEFEGKSGILAVDSRSATSGYFAALGIPLRTGRLFSNADRDGAGLVGIIDEHIARTVFASEDPIGKRFRVAFGTVQGPWTEIIGVVGHVRDDSPEVDLRPQVYWSEGQRAQDRAALVVRTAGDPGSMAAAVIEQIHHENPNQPVYDVRTMDAWLARTLQPRGLLAGLVSLFGAAALLMACLGLYGAVSYTTALRMREFGIRMALGARGSDIRRMVLSHAGRLALAGCVIGFLLTWPVGRAVQSLLYGVSNADTAAVMGAGALLLSVSLLAAAVPAGRAAAADPAVILRAE